MKKWDADVNSTVYKPKTQELPESLSEITANKRDIFPHSKFLIQFISMSLRMCGSLLK